VRPAAALPPLAALLLLAACGDDATRSNRRIFVSDLQGGARLCTVPDTLRPSAGATEQVRMTLSNEGGWCGLFAAQPGPEPYRFGLVTERPQNGRVRIQPIGDRTRIDYIPNRNFAGNDAFAVRLSPGDAVLRVAVTVQR
jgi:hypothetical protein